MDNTNKPQILAAGAGKAIMVGLSRLVVKLPSEQTVNRLSITTYELPPGFPGPPPHKHAVFEHAWYVLEGELTVQLGNDISVLSKGGFVYIPKQVVHAFANSGNGVAEVLVVDTPGGFEKYYDDLQAAFGNGEKIDQQIIRDIQLKYDTYPPDHIF